LHQVHKHFLYSVMARPSGTKSIQKPDEMWQWFEKYKIQTKANPIKVHDFVGKDGDSVERLKERPLTIEGFKNFCRRNVCEVRQYFSNDDDRYKDYINICHAIREEIRQDQIEGGMVMIYNPSITQRLNGLTDKTETKVEGEISIKQITGMEIK